MAGRVDLHGVFARRIEESISAWGHPGYRVAYLPSFRVRRHLLQPWRRDWVGDVALFLIDHPDMRAGQLTFHVGDPGTIDRFQDNIRGALERIEGAPEGVSQ